MATINRKNITTLGFDEDALVTFQPNETITNFAKLMTLGDLANGIFALADGVKVDNAGRIRTQGDGAQGIFVIGNSAEISNSGIIETTGSLFEEFGLYSDAIDLFGNDGRITNTGSIRTKGDFTSALWVLGDGNVVENLGSTESRGSNTAVIGGIGVGNTLLNSGTVVGSNTLQSGMVLFGFGGVISNAGSVTMTGGGFNQGLWGFGENMLVVNEGSVRLSGAPLGVAMIIEGGNHNEAVNLGLVKTTNDLAFGMGGAGFLGGLDMRLINEGEVRTTGNYSVGILNGAPRFDPIPGSPAGDNRPWTPTTDSLIVNSGSVTTTGDASAGIVTAGFGNQVINSGLVETFGGAADQAPMGALSASGIVASGADLIVFNTATGWIETHHPDSPAVLLNAAETDDPAISGASTLLNYGVIQAAQTSILGDGDDETVLNYGSISGDIALGAGDDVYLAGAGGELEGELFTGPGADLIVIEDGSGETIVGDFAAGPGPGDVLDVGAFNFPDLAGLLAQAQQIGTDVFIQLDADDSLVLKGLTLGQLQADDFLLSSPAVQPWQTAELAQVLFEYG